MADTRYTVKVADANGTLIGLSLATDDKGNPRWETNIISPINPNQVLTGEPTYANFLPRLSGVWDQPDLTGGMGVRLQKSRNDPRYTSYFYAEWIDASVPGQIQKGPAVKTLTAPANSGPMSGYFELAGVPYFCLGRIIANWNSGADNLTQVRDLGSGGVNSSGAVFNKDGTDIPTSDSSIAVGGVTAIDGPDKRLAQLIRPTDSGINYLGRVDCQLQRVGLAKPGAPNLTVVGGAAATYSYAVSATVPAATAGLPSGETGIGAPSTTTTGPTTLSTSAYISIGETTPSPGATGYNVYRTATSGASGVGATTGKIGTITTLGVLLDTGLPADNATPNTTDTSCQIPGTVRLTVQTDQDGRPSGTILDSATIQAMDVSMSAPTLYSFRFDVNDSFAMTFNEPFWIVMDVSNSSAHQTIQWTQSSGDSYTRGLLSVSTDGGQTWTNDASSSDFYFQVFSRATSDAVYVGADDSTNNFATTTDGSTYTPDTYRSTDLFAVVADRLVRSVRAGSQRGCIQYSVDGSNWSESLPVGNINEQVTALLTLGRNLIVVKQGSIWGVDVGGSTVQGLGQMIQLYYGNRISTNGQGSCIFKGTAYIPFSGRLVAVRGDFVSGWTTYNSVGPESLPEWTFPWGAGRIVATAPTRFYLYALMSTSGAYRLLKTRNPIEPIIDDEPSRRWHGSLAQIGDGTQTVTEMHVFDAGGTASPRLFITTTGNNVAEVILPRFTNPAADPNYQYDTTTIGDLYFARAHGSFPVHPKAWLNETLTFFQRSAGDYVDILYDTINDNEGFRRLGRAFDTNILQYPPGIASTLIDRRLRINNSLATASPRVHVSALTYAVRPAPSVPLRHIEFVVDSEDFQSAAALGDLLGLGNDSTEQFLAGAAIGGSGTRMIVDHRGRAYPSVLIYDVQDTLVEFKAEGSNRTMIKVTGVQMG